MAGRMSTAYMLTDDGIATPMVAPAGATLEQELDAARRALAAKQGHERDLTFAFGKIVAEAEQADVDAARAQRSKVRQEIGDTAALIHELEQRAEAAYTAAQRANADTVLTAAAQFDAALRTLLDAIRAADAAGRTMYLAANRKHDARADALLSLTWDTGSIVSGYMLDTLRAIVQRATPWTDAQPSLVDAARSRSLLIDFEE